MKMKKNRYLLGLCSLLTLCLLSESCRTDKSCPEIECNGAIQNAETCLCDCPEGYSGANCEQENLCITQEVDCQNGGTCANGICDCPEGFIGAHCELLDSNRVEFLLEQGYTPKEIYEGGVPLHHIYGKLYKRGLICFVDIHDEYPDLEGLVAWPENLGGLNRFDWGCGAENLPGLNDVTLCPDSITTSHLCFFDQWLEDDRILGARIGDGAGNTDRILEEMCQTSNWHNPNRPVAAQICRELGPDWHLPSRGELIKVHVNLQRNGFGFYETTFPYWSSTEYNNVAAWRVSFSETTGTETAASNKANTHNICAVRTF